MKAEANERKPHRGLDGAFELMTEFGLLARQRFECCSGCAGSALANLLIKAIDEDGLDPDSVKGAVFYHAQDAERLDEGKPFSLRFGPVELYRDGALWMTVGGSAEEIGGLACQCLHAAGCTFKWDGDPDKTIEVLTW
jgi:hypothetical protein